MDVRLSTTTLFPRHRWQKVAPTGQLNSPNAKAQRPKETQNTNLEGLDLKHYDFHSDFEFWHLTLGATRSPLIPTMLVLAAS
jgi:hypothetical protein